MTDESTRPMTILFSTPRGDTSGLHERTLDVPKPTAVEMVTDFEEPGDPESRLSPYQLYRFEEEGEEQLVALDFGEVAGMIV